MDRHRTIAAAPVRSAAEAWQVVSTLLAQTLERSPEVPAGSVLSELTPLSGLGPALIAGGHLESKGLVLCDNSLHLTISVLTADPALGIRENLNPVPGGGQATNGWILYVPLIKPLAASIAAAVNKSSHLSADTPPASVPTAKTQGRTEQSFVDLEVLRKMGANK